MDSSKRKVCGISDLKAESISLNGNNTTKTSNIVLESSILSATLPIMIDTLTNSNCTNDAEKIKRSRKQSLTLTPSPNISSSSFPALYSIDTRVQHSSSQGSFSKNSNYTGPSIGYSNYSFW